MPAAPQAVVVWAPGWRQVLPEQQPVAQLAAVQVHTPLEHTWPAPHAAPVPHRQAPPLQAFVVPVHAAHAAPPVPHAAAVWAAPCTHTPALQQPVGQLVASHTHAPPTHRWPAPQAALVPQRQAPAVQRSPVVPHEVHAAPAAPHAVAPVGVQTLPAQQPLGQLVASHTHAPPMQRWPVPQAAPVPHAQAPLRQLSDDGAPHAEHVAPPVPTSPSSSAGTRRRGSSRSRSWPRHTRRTSCSPCTSWGTSGTRRLRCRTPPGRCPSGRRRSRHSTPSGSSTHCTRTCRPRTPGRQRRPRRCRSCSCRWRTRRRAPSRTPSTRLQSRRTCRTRETRSWGRRSSRSCTTSRRRRRGRSGTAGPSGTPGRCRSRTRRSHTSR
jgi:hypothetical protein